MRVGYRPPVGVKLRSVAKLPAARLFLGAMLLGLYCAVAMAEADGPDYWRVKGIASDDSLSIRAQPSPRSAKLGDIPHDGACIRNLGCRGGLTYQEFSTLSKVEQAKRLRQNPRWCQVEYHGTTGWVAGRYLTEGGCP